MIFIRDILYCEVFDHRVQIHTIESAYDYSGTLDMLEDKLDERFFRCHRSFVVNIEEAKTRNEKYRRFQHDIDNHFLVLSGLIHEKKRADFQAIWNGIY